MAWRVPIPRFGQKLKRRKTIRRRRASRQEKGDRNRVKMYRYLATYQSD